MNSRQTPFRIFGQRSIAPSLLLRSSNPCKGEDDVQKKEPKRDSCASLTDFLDRKLKGSSVLPKPVTVQEKSRPFTSLIGPREVSGCAVDQIEVKKGRDEEQKGVLEKVVFEQFKQTKAEKVHSAVSSSANEEEITNLDELQESRKRKNPFENLTHTVRALLGLEGKNTTRKPFLILGDHPKPNHKGRAESYNNRKKARHPYNHYANGCGWWDCDMEGVDSEEVGSAEVWEGVGSTTFGGIVDWH